MNYFNYFTEIEEAFIRRRGRTLLLSPLDWALIESWKGMGVPLHVALRGIERAFDSYEAKPRRRTVKSLFYCQEEVEAQFAEWLEGQRGAASPAEANGAGAAEASDAAETEKTSGLPFPRAMIADHLAHAREAVAAAHAERERAGEGELAEALARAAARLAELETDFARARRPNAEHLEEALTNLEAMLDRSLRVAAQPAEVVAFLHEAEEQLRPYKSRMERATYEQTLENLLLKRLRDARRLPRLSLFYL